MKTVIWIGNRVEPTHGVGMETISGMVIDDPCPSLHGFPADQHDVAVPISDEVHGIGPQDKIHQEKIISGAILLYKKIGMQELYQYLHLSL